MIDCPVFPDFRQEDPKVLARFGEVATSLISDSMNRNGGAAGLIPFTRCVQLGSKRMVGQAMTVKTARGDNLIVHQALEMLRPNHILAVDAGGSLNRAIVGDIMCSYAEAQGATGLVIDGAIRDSKALYDLNIPVFAAGRNHQGPYKNGPGSIGGNVVLGGSVVCAGDVIVGDADGVVIVPLAHSRRILESAEAQGIAEERTLREIRDGSYRNDWLPQMVNVIPGDESGREGVKHE